MARSVPEWIGKTPDTAIPARVKDRIVVEAGGRCDICTRWVLHGYAFDHIIALINGGENRESNLQFICDECHKAKTVTDVAEKAVTARKRKKHLGIKKKQNRPMSGTVASGWRKRMDGTVERRNGDK